MAPQYKAYTVPELLYQIGRHYEKIKTLQSQLSQRLKGEVEASVHYKKAQMIAKAKVVKKARNQSKAMKTSKAANNQKRPPMKGTKSPPTIDLK